MSHKRIKKSLRTTFIASDTISFVKIQELVVLLNNASADIHITIDEIEGPKPSKILFTVL